MQIRGRANRKHSLHTVGRQAKDLGLEKIIIIKKVIFHCHSPDLQLSLLLSQGMKVPRQNSLLIQCVRQKNCPTLKSQCNADSAYSKARGYRGGCALRTGKEQPENENTDGHWQRCLLSALWDMATGTRTPQ